MLHHFLTCSMKTSQWWADDDEQFYYASGTATEGLYIKLVLPSGNGIGLSSGNITYPVTPDADSLRFIYKHVSREYFFFYDSGTWYLINQSIGPIPPFTIPSSTTFSYVDSTTSFNASGIWDDSSQFIGTTGGWFKFGFDNEIYRKVFHGGNLSSGGISAVATGGSPPTGDTLALAWPTAAPTSARHMFASEDNPTLDVFALFGSSGEWVWSGGNSTTIDIDLASNFQNAIFPATSSRESSIGDNSGLYTVANGAATAFITDQSNSGYVS